MGKYQKIDEDFLYTHMKRYDKRMLENLPNNSELNHIFSDRFNEKMDELIKDERKSTFFINFKYYSKTAIIYVILITSITLGVTATAFAYRVRIFEIISNVFKEFTSITISSDTNADDDKLIPIETDYIPTGFIITEREYDDYEQKIIYSNNIGKEIIYKQTLLTNTGIIIDTENTDLENIVMYDVNINILEKNDHVGVYWNDDKYFYSINGNVEKSIILEMSKNILQKNQKY